jgi:uncharacterized protein YkwD
MTFTSYRSALLLSVCLLSACGGGSSVGSSTVSSTGNTAGDTISYASNNLTSVSALSTQEPGAPIVTGNVARDGLNWFNFRRQQAGLPALIRNATMEQASMAHALYQKANNILTHSETPGLSGFTGVNNLDRMQAAGLLINPNGYAVGEVIAASTQQDGVALAENLVTAIYHRFLVFQPNYNEAGTGAATRLGGYTYLGMNIMLNQPAPTQTGRLVTWPFAQQKNVTPNFFSNQESPDPVPLLNEVGYPVSVHADLRANVAVNSFTIRTAGGAPLATRLLSAATDSNTSHSAAALIPLAPLLAATTYDVEFTGSVDGSAVSRQWSFTTR